MIGWVELLFESVAVAAVASVGASLACGRLAAVLGRLDLAPARRADLALLCGLLPASLAWAVVIVCTLPSALQSGGWLDDHCAVHAHHHRHLCAVHIDGAHPALLMVGVAATAWMIWRSMCWFRRERRAARAVASLERLGVVHPSGAFPVVVVPGATRLCLAVGVRRRRILVSGTLLRSLSPADRAAALSHEAAHLRRRDPLVLGLLALAGLHGVPRSAALISAAFRAAAEEAADADAAGRVGPVRLAGALIAVARLQLAAAPVVGLAFGGDMIERRVRALLSGALRHRPAWGLRACGVGVPVGALLFGWQSAYLHGLLENVLRVLP